MVVLEDYVCLGMVLQILLRQINLGLFIMIAARRIVLAISILPIMSSAMVIRSLGSQRRRQSGSVICPWNISGGALADVA